MRRVAFLIAMLALALPFAAWADTIDLTNQFGSISISNSGISSSNSELKSFGGLTATAGHSLGYVSFTTGALATGTLAGGGTFSSAGSTFDIFGKGKGMHNGLIFSGSFVGPITWTLTSPPGKKNLTFTLSGEIQGMLYNGHVATGTTTQYIYSSSGQLTLGIGHLKGGTTTLSSTPEPGTLGLLGTGLVGIAGLFRRRKSA